MPAQPPADTAIESRHLQQRMVDYLLGQGIRQFLDLGSGLPNMASTHQMAVVGQFRDAVPPGSSCTGTPPLISRNRADITRFFDGFSLVEPGLVRPAQWRPDLDDPLRSPAGADEPVLRPSASGAPENDRGAAWHLVGVGLKGGG